MKVREVMLRPVVCTEPGQSVESAAKILEHYNVGALPVCTPEGMLCGMLTDRDLVVRCMAANKPAASTTVRQVMTGGVMSVGPDMDAGVAAHLMGSKQIRRLPVVENGRLCGMVSLGDIACREEGVMDAADALTDITSGIRRDP